MAVEGRTMEAARGSGVEGSSSPCPDARVVLGSSEAKQEGIEGVSP